MGEGSVFVQRHLHARAPLHASLKRMRTTAPSVDDVPSRVIRFMDNGLPLASVCPSAPPDTPRELILAKRGGIDANLTRTWIQEYFTA